MLPLSRVAKQLGLTPQALKRRREAIRSAPPASVPAAPPFVEVAPAWRMPTAEVEVQRADGTRFRITYSEATPALVPLLQTFLESPLMLQLTPQSRIFLAVQPVDFRKGIDGLAALCRQTLSENPLGGAVYVFRNRTGHDAQTPGL